MKRFVVLVLSMGCGVSVFADTVYVSTNNASDGPGTAWANAFHTIQGAVDAASANDMVLVTNGVYDAGGSVSPGYGLMNRVMVYKTIRVESVNGPDETFIVGASDSGTNGSAAVRCVYLNDGATLDGFTLTNGYTLATGNWTYETGGGGLWLGSGEIASNCVVVGCSSSAHGGGIRFYNGGMVVDSSVEQCVSGQGGGIFMDHGGLLDRCEVRGNQASTSGGGSYCFQGGELRNSLFTENSSEGSGGGVSVDRSGIMENCTVVDNSCTNNGGGVSLYLGGAITNSIVYANTASGSGSNWSESSGSFGFVCTTPTNGIPGGTGCIEADPQFVGEDDYHLLADSSCINAGNNSSVSSGSMDLDGNPRILDGIVDIGAYEPIAFPPASVTITNPVGPLTVGDETSTITVQGTNNSYAVGTMVWNNSIGGNGSFSAIPSWTVPNISLAYGENVITISGWNSNYDKVSDTVTVTRVIYPASVTITNHPESLTVGEETPTLTLQGTNNPYTVGTMNWTNSATGGNGTLPATTSWAISDIPLVYGDNVISVSGSNWNSEVVSDTVTVLRGPWHGGSASPVHCVSSDGGDTYPYTNWATAAHEIQDALDAAAPADVVWVTNGVYDIGSRTTPGYASMNRVVLVRETTLQSVNGSDVTIIAGAEASDGGNGSDAVRGVYMSAGTLSGFTITNGHTMTSGDVGYEQSGGGINMQGSSGAVVTNCMILGNSADNNGGGSYEGTLNDCTLSGNSANAGGGSYGGTLNDCTLSENHSKNDGGGNYSGTLNRCMLLGNSAGQDGGATFNGSLNNCTVSNNVAHRNGGGICGEDFSCSLKDCIVVKNSAGFCGGGAYKGGHTGSLFKENWASRGGGSYGSFIRDCRISGNSANHGGGVSTAAGAINCSITGNSATQNGGGTYLGSVHDCIVAGNTSLGSGGGSAGYDGTRLFDTIIYHNTASDGSHNYDAKAGGENVEFHDCCTFPVLPDYVIGEGNVFEDPMLLSATHLHADSPSEGAGLSSLAPFNELLSVSLSAKTPNVVAGAELSFLPEILGNVDSNLWTFGDGTSLSNTFFGVHHSWLATGTYDVVLTAYNDEFPGGVSATAQVHVVADSLHYVDAGNASPAPPYASWTAAATTIQDAVDESAKTTGSKVWVTNGIYNTGATIAAPRCRSLNRLVITHDVVVQSMNGSDVTSIVGAEASGGGNGSNAVRGVYMSGGILSGFTITAGHTMTELSDEIIDAWAYDRSGGGINLYSGNGAVTHCTITDNSADHRGGGSFGGTMNNCTISSNSADCGGGAYCDRACLLNNCTLSGNTADYGGGVSGDGGIYVTDGGTLNNCTLTDNSASVYGGGADGNTLNNCTISDNYAVEKAGGTFFSTLNNCIVYFNRTKNDNDVNAYYSDLFYCCTTPDPGGTGNIASDPQFVGGNPPPPGSGATSYRLQTASPCIDAGDNALMPSDTDLDGTPRPLDGDTNGTAMVDMGAYEHLNAAADSDGDGSIDGDEQVAGTSLVDSNDWFHISGFSDSTVFFQSLKNRLYTLYWSTNLVSNVWNPLPGSRLGLGGVDSMTSTNTLPVEFYKLTVELP